MVRKIRKIKKAPTASEIKAAKDYILRKRGYHPTKTHQPKRTRALADDAIEQLTSQPGYAPSWAKPLAPRRKK